MPAETILTEGLSTPADIGSTHAIEKEIGRGGMATVHSARDLRHNRRVAVKVMSTGIAASTGTARFVSEITTAAGLTAGARSRFLHKEWYLTLGFDERSRSPAVQSADGRALPEE